MERKADLTKDFRSFMSSILLEATDKICTYWVMRKTCFEVKVEHIHIQIFKNKTLNDCNIITEQQECDWDKWRDANCCLIHMWQEHGVGLLTITNYKLNSKFKILSDPTRLSWLVLWPTFVYKKKMVSNFIGYFYIISTSQLYFYIDLYRCDN